MSPPIPTHLAGRPTHRGLVIPWISVILADGTPVLGNVHGTKVETALWGRLCQICGERLNFGQVVLFASASSHAEGGTSEPGMHPECAAYSAKSCPMVNGRMTHYTDTDRVAGKPCSEPGCDCDGWISTQPASINRPAEPWYAVWVRDYAIGVDPGTKRANSAIYRHITPLKIRLLTTETSSA